MSDEMKRNIMGNVNVKIIGKAGYESRNTMLKQMGFNGQAAKVTFSLALPIKIGLTDPKMWVKLCIFFQHKMKSKYGIALWENLSDYARLKKITYDIDQFKQLMGLEPHQYKVITMLKKKVIEV